MAQNKTTSNGGEASSSYIMQIDAEIQNSAHRQDIAIPVQSKIGLG